jgi:hypothetical protein
LSLEVSVTNNNSIAVSAGGSIANQSLTNAIPAAVWPRMHVNGMLAIGAGGGLGMGYVSSTSGQVGVASADATGTARTIPADNPYVGTFTWMI